MTDEQLEAIARDYCRRMGDDPDRMVTGGDRTRPTLARNAPLWQWQVDKVRDHAAMAAAIGALHAKLAKESIRRMREGIDTERGIR